MFPKKCQKVSQKYAYGFDLDYVHKVISIHFLYMLIVILTFDLFLPPKSIADVEILLLPSFVEFHTAVAEKSKMSQPIKGREGHLCFSISLKNKNLVENVEILLPVKFQRILFSHCRGEVENVKS